ncbi:uncharacterized protein LOC122500543 [Leptopilina heterotoma]|uniref:uncharacterized protein LOC122500543 n=1 Tax=Leptopilina heterotoma TaxID=63436 RepID=UPI001CA9FA5E|nr:uncharacterized protein LOC122500543 [Leptopilina heterotoma]
MSSKKRDQEGCNCERAREKSKRSSKKSSTKGKPSRKRQTLVFNPDEETYAEPYMKSLGEEFSRTTLVCDSKIELPWREISIKTNEIKIRKTIEGNNGELETNLENENKEGESTNREEDLEEKKSNGQMVLPWKLLVISGVVQPQNISTLGLGQCDSKLEIPWDILCFDSPVKINPTPEVESCNNEIDDVQIPWNDLMIPQNLVIEAKKIIEHPSNKHPPRSALSAKRRGCSPCIRAQRNSKKII